MTVSKNRDVGEARISLSYPSNPPFNLKRSADWKQCLWDYEQKYRDSVDPIA